MILGFILLFLLLSFLFVFYFVKFKILKGNLESLYTYNRIGFRNDNFNDLQIEVEEIERYKNGYSRLKIRKIKCTASYNSRGKKNDFKNDFKEIQETCDWNWLERDEDLMDVRRKKLSRLLKIFKNNE